MEIAENVLEAEGRLDLNPGAEQLELNLSLAGQELAKLTPLTGLDLPPITDYSVTGSLKAQEGVFQLDRFHFRTASSELDGKLRVGRNGELVLLEAQLDAPAIQLDDFLFDNWSWLADAQAEATARETHPSAGDRGEGERLLSPQLLRTVEGRIAVRAGRVLSGKDHMGAGRLLLEMGDNTLRLSPLVLEFPGGVIRAEVDLALGERTMSGTIRSRIEDFDIGVWARRQQPDTGIGGLVNLDMELSGEGESIAEILDHGDGYLDFSGRLTGFESGGVDLWAVNLVRAALFSLKRDTSYINCAVGRFRAEAGRLIPDTLFVDTTGIRICGMGEVELPGRKMNMLFYPVAKKSQFYSLALPVKVEGSFGDLGFRFPKTELLGTAVTFLTSPIHVPLRWLTEKPIPADGSDVCGMELGPVARQTKVPGCFRSDLP